MRTGSARGSGGWSLVELSVVLAVVGVLGVVLWRVLPLGTQVATNHVAERELARAEQALVGYVLAHHQLPAPVSEDGLDMLPADALGLPSTMRLRYQVQSSLTTAPANLFSPLLPPGILGGKTVSAELNGLDFCMALKNARLASLTGMQGIPTAFALMHPGPVGHDNQAAAPFVLPGSAAVGTRHVLAVGPGELASRLACPDRVARTRAAARAANAAHDLQQVAERYRAFREFAIQVAEMNEDNAETGLAFATFDVAMGVLTEALAILQEAVGYPPDALGIATGITAHVTAGIQLGLAVDALVQAEQGLQKARADLVTANDQKRAADANLGRMQDLAAQTLLRAKDLDRRGLQP